MNKCPDHRCDKEFLDDQEYIKHLEEELLKWIRVAVARG
ncbi:hypothetical protein LCGC14_0267920 [marine sediment metagenome]|uniref:Uncharacterized protein n=1 Tax=marine sediment metagenome TaxID=412755 RepID=A0A0F9WKS2_9ZZZZ